jgi:hypothetical protein
MKSLRKPCGRGVLTRRQAHWHPTDSAARGSLLGHDPAGLFSKSQTGQASSGRMVERPSPRRPRLFTLRTSEYDRGRAERGKRLRLVEGYVTAVVHDPLISFRTLFGV